MRPVSFAVTGRAQAAAEGEGCLSRGPGPSPGRITGLTRGRPDIWFNHDVPKPLLICLGIYFFL